MSEQDWKISRPAAQCKACHVPFSAGSVYFSSLIPEELGFSRVELCADCFESRRPSDIYYFWKSTVPSTPHLIRKPKPVLDFDNVLEFFKRLEGDSGVQKIAFRYILALMLTRKKILVASEKKKDAQGRVVQHYREKISGSETLVHAVVEPDLNEQEIDALSSELSALLGMVPVQESVPVQPPNVDHAVVI